MHESAGSNGARTRAEPRVPQLSAQRSPFSITPPAGFTVTQTNDRTYLACWLGPCSSTASIASTKGEFNVRAEHRRSRATESDTGGRKLRGSRAGGGTSFALDAACSPHRARLDDRGGGRRDRQPVDRRPAEPDGHRDRRGRRGC